MTFLFCNCLTDRGVKFKALVEKYAIFDNLVFNGDKTQTLVLLQSEYLDLAFSSDLA
jgi:Putative phage abortive infection protein